MCKVTIKRFQPSAGFGAFNPIDKFLSGETITVKIQFGGSGLAMVMEGVVQAPSISGSASAATELTVTIDGKASSFEGGIGL